MKTIRKRKIKPLWLKAKIDDYLLQNRSQVLTPERVALAVNLVSAAALLEKAQ